MFKSQYKLFNQTQLKDISHLKLSRQLPSNFYRYTIRGSSYFFICANILWFKPRIFNSTEQKAFRSSKYCLCSIIQHCPTPLPTFSYLFICAWTKWHFLSLQKSSDIHWLSCVHTTQHAPLQPIDWSAPSIDAKRQFFRAITDFIFFPRREDQ